ncbi:MAG TPA: hypothetical protein PLX04_02025 [Caldisericia bacterium]|nr:hypothetical protein [Caldisericia bacterium]HOR46498.1 hypothetical protein [Caldisericia bacterium]HOU08355.1 hypothetical protein [Caldisericia bacterium]HPL89026.1 hypothetical protein [Caldisericia bacterium]HQG60279.1 hypothetical protein [Caldisericia bacterium]
MNEGTFASEIINRSLLYGILGYLPEEICNVLVLDGPKQTQMALILENAGYKVARICPQKDDDPTCIASTTEGIDGESFGVVICPGWLSDNEDPEKISREAMRLLVQGGFFFGSVPGRFAAAVDCVPQSTSNASSIANGIDETQWWGTKELFTPNDIACELEAIGFEVVDLYGWEHALTKLPGEKLSATDWDEGFFEDFLELEFRLAQERSILGMAPTIQFVAKKPNPEP